VHQPRPTDVELLGATLGFHPLTLEDTAHFGQRPKCEDYEDFAFLVVYGHAPDADSLVEVHCYFSARFLVTVRRDEAPSLEELRRELAARGELFGDGVLVLYRVVDALVDGFFALLGRFDDRLELIEEAMISSPSEAQLQDVFKMRRRLVALRRTIVPQRDLFGRLAGGVAALPGMTSESEHYFRDVHDHLIRLADQLEGQRELMTGAIDLYLSTSSNRLNTTIKQLTVVATIFLPLSFITGFFGQNFGWLVDNVGGWGAFLGLGLGLELAAVFALLGFFKRRGWF